MAVGTADPPHHRRRHRRTRPCSTNPAHPSMRRLATTDRFGVRTRRGKATWWCCPVRCRRTPPEHVVHTLVDTVVAHDARIIVDTSGPLLRVAARGPSDAGQTQSRRAARRDRRGGRPHRGTDVAQGRGPAVSSPHSVRTACSRPRASPTVREPGEHVRRRWCTAIPRAQGTPRWPRWPVRCRTRTHRWRRRSPAASPTPSPCPRPPSPGPSRVRWISPSVTVFEPPSL
jgi:hypothetical protein